MPVPLKGGVDLGLELELELELELVLELELDEAPEAEEARGDVLPVGGIFASTLSSGVVSSSSLSSS